MQTEVQTVSTAAKPFYAAKRQRVVGDPRLWDLAYFHTLEDAERYLAAARAAGRFGYVLETTEGQIWRATVNHVG